MISYLGLVGSLTASTVALVIAILGWRRSDKRAQLDKEDAVARERANLLADLLELHFDALAAQHIGKNDAKMKAILLRLPGHLATTLRVRLKLGYTMKDVPLDPASAKRLGPATTATPHEAGYKWMIFDRSSVLKGRGFEPYPEWIEAELAYDIAGQRGGDQDAVLRALSHDVRNPQDAVIAQLQQHQEQREITSGDTQ
ncbi:hypothetical protein ACFQ1S_00975 [Kibdelosporangium lantanae]|uniref:Uncharacterized protein n=1 Tax=Kibdelosporangium lantanae TaxID=1497396 RepID=A0ABW3M0T4_9PSEU